MHTIIYWLYLSGHEIFDTVILQVESIPDDMLAPWNALLAHRRKRVPNFMNGWEVLSVAVGGKLISHYQRAIYEGKHDSDFAELTPAETFAQFS